MPTDVRVYLSWNLLRFSYGSVLLLAGLDKLFGTNLITHWFDYISPLVKDLLPVSTGTFLLGMGVIEVAFALMLLGWFPGRVQKAGAYFIAVWFVVISANLMMLGLIDIMVRDILLAVGAVVLAQLTTIVGEQRLAKASV
jgi:hypothetical protein